MQQLSFNSLIENYRLERLSSKDMINQLHVVKRSLLGFHALDNVHELQKDVVLAWRDWLLQERGVSRATWNNYHRHLRTLLNFAVENEILTASPLKGIRSLVNYDQKKKLIPAQDVQELMRFLELAEVKGTLPPVWFWRVVIRTLYYTGMRRKQLVGMKWEDIDFDMQKIILRADSSKTKRSWEIPLPPQCREDLETLKQLTRNVRGRSVSGQEQVFNVTLFHPRYKGDQLTTMQLSGFFRRLMDESGITVSPHRFRHSFGTQAAKTGEIRQVQAQLGHTNVKTTYEYVQPDIEGMRRVGSALQSI